MKRLRGAKRFMALLLTLVMALGMFPVSALAADTCTVSVYTTANDLTFENAGGQEVTPGKSTSGAYRIYTLNDVPAGTYTYASEQYGTGVLKLSKDGDIYLRVVDFTFAEGGSPFHMTVTNTDDEELVYTSPRTNGLSTKLLVPALGWGVTYRYDFMPDEGWCSFFGPLWVLKGTEELIGFKRNGYNLSDGSVYVMGQETEMTFRVPKGSKLNVYTLVKFYRAPSEYHTKFERTEGNYDIYTAKVTTAIDSVGAANYFYTVTKDNCVTTSATFYALDRTVTVEPESIEGDPHQQVKQSKEASVITNGNRSKFIALQPGEEFAIWSSRAWQAIDGGTSNRYVEPDKHYYVVSGDAVTVDDIGTVTAVREGTAIVAMTYDAMNYQGQFYSAIESQSVAVFVFTVGGNSEGITTGLINSSDLDTHYVASTVAIDGQAQPIETNSSVPYTFTPTDANNEEISVRVCTLSGYPTPSMSSWRGYQEGANGSYTIDLYPGRNVVEITAGSRKAYHVLNCRSTNVSITNNSAPGEVPKQDESVTVRFDGIITPLPKLGAIYNPGFGGTVFLEGTLNRPGGSTETVTSNGVQYNLGDAAAISVPLAASGDYSLTGLRIHSGSFGSASGAHLALSRQSEGGSYEGEDSPETVGYFSYLPIISFSVESADHEATAAAIMALIDGIGEVRYTPECLERLKAARRAYDSASAAVKALITEAQLKVLTDGEKKYAGLDEEYVASNIQTREINQQEFYVLTSPAELKWFAKLVNGTLAGGEAADPDANAILGNSITVNEAVLGDDFQLMAVDAEQWTSIGTDTLPYAGIFDGDGFFIDGIYQSANAADGAGLFAANAGTIRNLTVGDSYFSASVIGYSGDIGGIATTNAEAGVIENVTFRGYLGISSANYCDAGGIVSENKGTIHDCRMEGKVVSTDKAGGIAHYSSSGSISRCVNAGTVSGKDAAGIVLATQSGSLTACYSSAEAQVKGVDSASGIVDNITRSTIAFCYNAGKVSAEKTNSYGIYCEAESRSVNVAGPCYYLYGTASGGIIQGKVERKTQAQFTSGEVAYLLGGEYGQKIGEDAYPLFNNGSNGVFFVDGRYANASAEVADKLISEIGTVALDGSANCFAKATAAKTAYDGLPEAEQAKVTKAPELTLKLNDYDSAVSQLNELIAKLTPVTADSGADVEAARTAYNNYRERGGDLSRVTDAERIAKAEEEYFQFCLEAIGQNIVKRTVNGAEYYVLTNADELYWFAGLVNGTLPAGGSAVTGANALLENDIVVNAGLLDTILEDGVNIRQDYAALQRKWTPIGTYNGIFDGQGHSISGLCIVEGSDGALFRELNGATVKNLTVEDAYFRGNSVAGFATNMQGNTVLDRCGFIGVASSPFMRAGALIVNLSGGEVRNCYTRGAVSVEEKNQPSQTFSGGIAAVVNGTIVIENCYVACNFAPIGAVGGIAGMAHSSGVEIRNCYFETNDTVNTAIGDNQSGVDPSGAAGVTIDQFTSGEVAYRLGGAFGQDLASDVYPVFNNGANTIYYVNGNYYNRTLQVVKNMIDDIGTVALDGDEDCFRKTADAQKAFSDLSVSMQNAIGAAYRGKLQRANDDYGAVVSALNDEISAIRPFKKEDMDGKYKALTAKLEQYTSRGGDVGRISNYGLLPDIKAELDEKMLLWTQENVEADIQIRTIDEKEYYVLTDVYELNWFICLVNGDLKTGTAQNAAANAVLENNITLNQNLVKTIILNGEVDSKKAVESRPIAAGMSSYAGIFDGDGHAISGLYMPDGSLFGTLAENAAVKNLKVTDAVIQSGNGGIAETVSGGAQVSGCTFSGALFGTTNNIGGIAGEAKSGASIKDCRVSGSISSSKKNVGGIAGLNSGEIITCAASEITLTSSSLLPYVGGITAKNENGGIVRNCYARGKVEGTHKTAGQYIAGIAGENKATLENCYSACEIISNAATNCGGIAGKDSGTISNCYYQEGFTGVFFGIGKSSDVEGKTESRTAAQFADGSVTAALNKGTGDAFMQHGEYPELKAQIPTYSLTVVSGTDTTGSGPYAAGVPVGIKAEPAPDNMVFDKWTASVGGVIFGSASAAETTVTMPDSDVTVTANYRKSSVTLTPKVTASNGAASASVSASDMSKAVDDAKENDGAPIVIAPEITGTASKVGIELPKSSLASVASETSAALTVKTPVGSVTIPNDALASVAAQASGSTITVVIESVEKKTLTAEQQKAVGDNPVFDISIISNGESISGFGGKSITISLPYTLKDGGTADEVKVWYLNDKGELEQIVCSYDVKTGLATFTTDHLSYYTVGVEKSEQEAVAAAKAALQEKTWSVPMSTANTEQTVKSWLEAEIAKLSLNGVTAAVNTDSFTAAAGGAAGSFTFTVKLSKGEGETKATDSVQLTGTISAESQINRIAGGNRYDTSAKTALQAYPDGAKTVIIARGDDQGNFADALAASYLAGVEKAPILLTSPGSLPQEIEAAIKQLGAQKAYVLGGELAVSQGVENKLKNLGLQVERITGQNRYATAAAIAAKGGPADTAIVLSGFAPADSLVAGPLAFGNRYPILLVDKNSVPAETKKAIADLGIKNIIVIGGENAVSKAVYSELQAKERYAGQSRIETSLDVAEKAFAEAKDFSIVGYLKLADAVGAAVSGNPIIYVKNDISDVEDYLKGAAAANSNFTIFGGPLAVNNTVEQELQKLLQ